MSSPTSKKSVAAILLRGLVFIALAAPAIPLTRSGKACPTGYYGSGDYCVPRNDATLRAV